MYGQKKMGRPTDNPRNKQITIRLAENEIQDLQYCADKLGTTKTEVVIKGIQLIKSQLETKK